MNILIKFPTRNRPDKFIQLFLKYQHMLSSRYPAKFIVTMDLDDPTMNNTKIRNFLNKHTNVSYFYGESKSKIEAINANMDNIGNADIILLASDDMIPIQVAYDDIIVTDMRKNFPDLDGVLHYNDGRQGDLLNTFCVMGRKYYDRFGYIYHPAYTSVYADNEFTSVSRMLGKAKYSPLTLFQHGWINFVGRDALVERNEHPDLYKKDKEIYEARLKIGFANDKVVNTNTVGAQSGS